MMSVNNYNVLSAFKVADEIVCRLFNHKPFIEGEMRFMVKEFEETRNESEITQMFECLERCSDTTETAVKSAIKWCQQLNKTDSCGDSVLNLMREIVELEAIYGGIRGEQLRDERERRNEELAHLTQAMQRQQHEIDSSYERKEDKLKQFYADLETKLRIGAN